LHFSRVTLLIVCAFYAVAADDQTSRALPRAPRTTSATRTNITPVAIATDANGNTFVTRSRTIQLPGTGASSADIFVAKVDFTGNPTALATWSGKGGDQANGIALDPARNIYIVGSTTSTNFPLHHPLQSVASQSSIGGTGFVVKMTADGIVLYSTYLGGTTGYHTMNNVVADTQGNAMSPARPFASDYPHAAGLPAGAVGGRPGAVSAAFFAKFSPAGDKIVYAGGLTAGHHAPLHRRQQLLSAPLMEPRSLWIRRAMPISRELPWARVAGHAWCISH
jgi:hypothetical protein